MNVNELTNSDVSYLNRTDLNSPEFSMDNLNDFSRILTEINKRGISTEKMKDTLYCGRLGFNRINFHNNGTDAFYRNGDEVYLCENKKIILGQDQVTLEDTGEKKADLFSNNASIFMLASMYFPAEDRAKEVLLDDIYNKIESRLMKCSSKEEIKEVEKFFELPIAIEEFSSVGHSEAAMFVYGRTCDIIDRNLRGYDCPLTMTEYSNSLGDRRKNLKYSFRDLFLSNFIVIPYSFTMELTKMYYALYNKDSYNDGRIRFVEYEDFIEHSFDGDFDYYFRGEH